MSSATLDRQSVDHSVVSRERWVAARKELLAREKAHTRERDELARERRELPWVRVEKDYVFETPAGKRSLGDLFGSKSQLVVYHFMFGPDWQEGCPGCSFVSDGFDGALVHATQRDVAFVAVSRAPLAKIEPFKRRMGWKFAWVSSFGSDFNHDFGVSFTEGERASGKCYNYGSADFPTDEAPGMSVFYKSPSGEVFHTYSTYGRGLEPLLGAYDILELTPSGRQEDGLPMPMAWVRHHDKYGQAEHGFHGHKQNCECHSEKGKA